MSDFDGKNTREIATMGADIALAAASGRLGHRILIPANGGSNPPAPASYKSLFSFSNSGHGSSSNWARLRALCGGRGFAACCREARSRAKARQSAEISLYALAVVTETESPARWTGCREWICRKAAAHRNRRYPGPVIV